VSAGARGDPAGVAGGAEGGAGAALLTGPIAVRGARPGDALEMEFLSIEPSLPMGWNAIRSGWGVLPERFDEPKLRFVPIDRERGTCEPAPGVRVPVEPFFGILGVAPTGEAVSSIPPGAFGGNLDCRELRAGAKLYLPVQVDGAMFSIGDGHAAQGDGEVNVTAVECSMNGSVRLTVREDVRYDWPFALTPTHVVRWGLATRWIERCGAAVERMIELLGRLCGVGEEDAYVLCCVAGSFRVTQAVNAPVVGVHGMVARDVLPGEVGALGAEARRGPRR
jgi:acetamidase/formamidase